MTRSANDVLEESFLDVRAKLIEVAACLDRIDRTAESTGTCLSEMQLVQREKIRAAIEICGSNDADRAERLQQLFSRSFDPDWRQTMSL